MFSHFSRMENGFKFTWNLLKFFQLLLKANYADDIHDFATDIYWVHVRTWLECFGPSMPICFYGYPYNNITTSTFLCSVNQFLNKNVPTITKGKLCRRYSWLCHRYLLRTWAVRTWLECFGPSMPIQQHHDINISL